MTEYRTVVYLQNFLWYKRGQIDFVDLDMALNMERCGIARRKYARFELQQLAAVVR